MKGDDFDMHGKIIKLNDFNFNFGQENVYLTVYAVFKVKKSGNRYAIYSYDNKKLYSGSAFIRKNELVIMISKTEEDEIIKDFVLKYAKEEVITDYEFVSLEDIKSIQIIDENVCDVSVDLNKLYDLSIPKVEVKKEETTPRKKISITSIFLVIFILVVALFFFMNPEVITGKNITYLCNKSYYHDELPASVNEEVELLFNSKGEILNIDIKSDYVFSDVDYYKTFRDKSYFYQYFKDGDTYKFDDNTYTYRLFSSVDTENDFFLPKDSDGLIKYYQDLKYECKVVSE